MQYLIPLIFIIPIAVVLWQYWNMKKNQKLLPDTDPVQDLVVPDIQNKHNVFIAPAEAEIWNSLPRKEKRKAIRQQEKMIESGKLVRVIENGKVMGIITRQEALRKGLIK